MAHAVFGRESSVHKDDPNRDADELKAVFRKAARRAKIVGLSEWGPCMHFFLRGACPLRACAPVTALFALVCSAGLLKTPEMLLAQQVRAQ